MLTPTFHSRDPSQPDFWDERFRQQFMPWDKGSVPMALRQFLSQAPQPYVTLIPGCGNGYEVAALAEAGWNVTAIDFSPAAVRAAHQTLGRWAVHVVEADFFTYLPKSPLQLIYERAFLCALPPGMRPAVAERWAELLSPGGLLAGFFYFNDDTPKGPPFGIRKDDLEAMLEPHFECIEDAPVTDSIAVFAGKERWQVWRRRSSLIRA